MEDNGVKKLSPIVDSLVKVFDRAAVADAVSLLTKLLGNIAAHPGDIKYRKIKATNKTLAARVFALRGIEELLFSLGFERDGEFFVYNG